MNLPFNSYKPIQLLLLFHLIINITCSIPDSYTSNTINPTITDKINEQYNNESSTIESSISNYLSTLPPNEFHIQGWKWHTLSLIRDSKRLEQLAQRLLSSDTNENPLEQATKHVIDFNMKALHKIENELFFPFLKQKLASDEIPKDIQHAFGSVIKDIEEDREHISKIATALREQAKIASLPSIPNQKRLEAIDNVAKMSGALTFKTRGIYSKEEKYLIPAISALVSTSEQKSFSNKVLRKLGILDSRLHLVGMHDAVWEKGDESERELFVEAIPYIPRLMIPRWRKTLYEPQAGVLD